MISLSSLMEQAQQAKGSQVALRSGQIPSLRKGTSWMPLGNTPIPPATLRSWALEFLDEAGQAELNHKRIFQIQRLVQGASVQLTIGLGQEALSVDLFWFNDESTEPTKWGYPAGFSQSLTLPGSFHLVVSPQPEARLAGTLSWVREAGFSQGRPITVFSDQPDWAHLNRLPGSSVYPVSTIEAWRRSQVSSPLVIVDSSARSAVAQALEWAVQGQTLLVCQAHNSVVTALQHLVVSSLNPSETQWMLSKAFQTALGVRLLVGSDEQWLPIYELASGSETLKSAMRAGDWNQVEAVMENSGDRTGMRTLNQAILQAILKRRIDMKAAFEQSLDPEALDRMLKRVGV